MGAGKGKGKRTQAVLASNSPVYDLLPQAYQARWLSLPPLLQNIFVTSPLSEPQPVAGTLRQEKLIDLLQQPNGVGFFNIAKDTFLENINNNRQNLRWVNLGSQNTARPLVLEKLDLCNLDFTDVSLGNVIFRSCDLRGVQVPQFLPASHASFEYCLADDSFWKSLQPYGESHLVTKTDKSGQNPIKNTKKPRRFITLSDRIRYGWESDNTNQRWHALASRLANSEKVPEQKMRRGNVNTGVKLNEFPSITEKLNEIPGIKDFLKQHINSENPAGTVHINPDGSTGGFVSASAKVAPTAYVAAGALVLDNAQVLDNAVILDHAIISENAIISDNVTIAENAHITDNARVSGDAQVRGTAWVGDTSQVCDNARVYGNAQVKDFSTVAGEAQVYENALIRDKATVMGKASVSDAIIQDHAAVEGNAAVWGCIKDFALVTGDAIVHGEVSGQAIVTGRSLVNETSKVKGKAKVDGNLILIRCELTGDILATGNGTLSDLYPSKSFIYEEANRPYLQELTEEPLRNALASFYASLK